MMRHTTEKFTNTKLEDLFTILFQRVESGVKYKVDDDHVRDDYPDVVSRTITVNHRLNPGRRSGNKITWSEALQIYLSPGRKDPNNKQELNTSVTHTDALSFTGYQIRDDVLIEIEYLDTWQELLDRTVAELRSLYPEPVPLLDEDKRIWHSKTFNNPDKVELLRTRFVSVLKSQPSRLGFLTFKKIEEEQNAFYQIYSQDETHLGTVEFSPIDEKNTAITYLYQGKHREIFDKIKMYFDESVKYYKNLSQDLCSVSDEKLKSNIEEAGYSKPASDGIKSAKKHKTVAKPRKKKSKKNTTPVRYEDAKKWVLAWEVIEPMITSDSTLEIDYDELRPNLKARGLKFGNETIKKIIPWGKSKYVLTLSELDRKFNK